MDDSGSNNTTHGWELLDRCDCDVVLLDLVLPPYFLIPVSVLILTALSVLINTLELRFRFGYSRERIRLMTGTATITALANPPWWFLAPQVLYHVAHLGFILFTTVRDFGDTASAWDVYTLAYAKWINGGATVFVVFGMVGGEYTRQIIIGQRSAALSVADPRSDVGEEVDLHIFRKNYLQAKNMDEIEEVRTNYESKAEFMGDEDEWDKGLRAKRIFSIVILVCLLPAFCTHILPGFVCYVWISGIAFLLLHFTCKHFVIPRQKCLGLLGRIVLLDALLALYAVVIQDTFNFTLLLYQGERYMDMYRTFGFHSTYCFMCATFADMGNALHFVSLM